MAERDTIFAPATARGRSGVAVVRVSGSGAEHVLMQMTGGVPEPRRATFTDIKDPDTGEVLDRGLVIFFAGAASFTGEPVAEFQLHGSVAVLDRVMRALGAIEGCRIAEPGEFTKRALLNGKMGLTEVEGLGDLINAETEAQRRQAARIMEGELRDKSEVWRRKLLEINSLLMVSIDFSDEELPADVLDGVDRKIESLEVALRWELDGAGAARTIRDGFHIAILGPPNAGKSTFLNTLAGREVAIASDIAGTTRDIVEVRLDLNGVPVVFSDTAGLRETHDEIERIGVERARKRAREADIRIILIDRPGDLEAIGLEIREDDLILKSKSDLGALDGFQGVSSLTGDGFDDLLDKLADHIGALVDSGSSLVAERHVLAIRSACAALRKVRDLISGGDYDIEICAELLRDTSVQLDQLIGKFDVELVLGEVFSNFCLGK